MTTHDEPDANAGLSAPPSKETYRATLEGRSADGCPATLIVTRQGLGRAGRIWLTFLGALKTTVSLSDDQAAQLAGLLHAARRPSVR
jgi:hypothetical protein